MAFFDQAVQETIAEAQDQLKRQKIRAAIESYADDICVGARTQEDLERAVLQLLTVYDKYGWTASPKKCQYGVNEVELLGHRFTPEGVLPPPKSTLQKLLAAEPPQTKTAVRSFLGLLRTLLHYCKCDLRRNLAAPLQQSLTAAQPQTKTPVRSFSGLFRTLLNSCKYDRRSLAALSNLTNANTKVIQRYWAEDPNRWATLLRSLNRSWYHRSDAAGRYVDLYVDARMALGTRCSTQTLNVSSAFELADSNVNRSDPVATLSYSE